MAFALSAAAQEHAVISDKAQTGYMGPGRIVEAASSNVAYTPTAAQIAAHERQMEELELKTPAPPLGPHTTAADVARAGGPPTEPSVQQSATSFTVFKNSLINSTCSGCAQSTVNEPSVANSGKTVIAISNWNIAYTTNGGASPITWANQDPYTISSGYCCDQVILYNPDRDVFIMLLLDAGGGTNGFTLSVTRGSAPTSWCTYSYNGSNFGEGASDTLDFPKIAQSNNYLFVTWNDYPGSSFKESGLVRMPLDSLAACAGFSYQYVTRNTEFTFALTQGGAHDQFYWVADWFLDGTTSGANERIFWWPDNSGSYFYSTVGINAYNFSIAACGSPNWCSRLDPRYEAVVITPAEFRGQANSAFAGDDILEVAGTAGPSSFSNGNNYVVYNYFKLHSLSYIGNDQTYNTSETFAYPACNVNEKGYVGCGVSYGLNAPGGLVLLQDNVSPTQPWALDVVAGGIGGATAWGDYNFVNPWRPGGGPFETVSWNVSSGGAVQPYYVVWGRGSDKNDYNRWKSK
jgi:hypothetical protein